MTDAAKIIRIDAEVLNIRVLMHDKDDPAFKNQLEELLARRTAILASMESKALEQAEIKALQSGRVS